MAQTSQPQATVTPKLSARTLAEIVKKDFPQLTQFLGKKVGTTLRIREGETPQTYVFYEKTDEGDKDIGTCRYDQALGRKTYTGHFPNTKLPIMDTQYINRGNGLEAVSKVLQMDLSTGNPVTLTYNLKAEDDQKRVVPKREDIFSQLPFP